MTRRGTITTFIINGHMTNVMTIEGKGIILEKTRIGPKWEGKLVCEKLAKTRVNLDMTDCL